jgi:hypothetical protein
MLVLSSMILIKSKRYSRRLLDRSKITIKSQGKIVKNKELSLKRYFSYYLATKKGVGSQAIEVKDIKEANCLIDSRREKSC